MLDTVAVLGSDADTIWPRHSAGAVQGVNGRFYVGGSDHPGTFLIYSPTGQLEATFGHHLSDKETLCSFGLAV
ncbi:MAG TPA: hypothetical protein VMN60_00530 [Longimicrobiales bacterium]|nr:hypothetical protein [Longimicrobiales bacterium]